MTSTGATDVRQQLSGADLRLLAVPDRRLVADQHVAIAARPLEATPFARGQAMGTLRLRGAPCQTALAHSGAGGAVYMHLAIGILIGSPHAVSAGRPQVMAAGQTENVSGRNT